ncbi:Cof-type HAD-IIB family hydrolase [Streptomyces fungicidicus]|uniref:Cof-type HAD-IIB family hydrolase n=1 Tax=Streptomyces fungicidicus TaxID=68203 RepID=UPI00177E8175|nr:Cof-type HAD-IIB family hydrolase [Streptomyces fungicidicus]
MRHNRRVTSVTPLPRTPAAPSVPIRLIATDLDGTLLRDDKTISPRTRAALGAAERAGIGVLFVTGRPARWMEVVRDHAHADALAICGNGAAVVDLAADDERGRPRFVRVRPLLEEAALQVVSRLRAHAPGTSFAVERTSGLFHEMSYPPLHLDPAQGIAPAEKLLAEPTGTTPQPVLKLLAHHHELAPDAFLTRARAILGDLVSVTRSSPTALLEISAHGVSKASTLALSCAERGIRPEEVAAFGDMPNDIEMLSWAGSSYAMGNAHPNVLATATGSTLGNNEDGVALVIERILAGG